jgi:hypothetical protein
MSKPIFTSYKKKNPIKKMFVLYSSWMDIVLGDVVMRMSRCFCSPVECRSLRWEYDQDVGVVKTSHAQERSKNFCLTLK